MLAPLRLDALVGIQAHSILDSISNRSHFALSPELLDGLREPFALFAIQGFCSPDSLRIIEMTLVINGSNRDLAKFKFGVNV